MLAWAAPSQCPRESRAERAPEAGLSPARALTSLSGLRARGCSREGVGTLLEADGRGRAWGRDSQLQDPRPPQPPALPALTYTSLKMSQWRRLSSAEPGGAGVQGLPRACPP